METSQSHSRVKALNQIPFSIGQKSIEVINFAPTSHRKSGKQVEQRTRPGKVLEILQIREKSRKMILSLKYMFRKTIFALLKSLF